LRGFLSPGKVWKWPEQDIMESKDSGFRPSPE